MNREDVGVSLLLGTVMASIRSKQYELAVEPLLKLREFAIVKPLQMTEGEKLSLQNLEDCVSAALLRQAELGATTLNKVASR